MDLAWMTKKQNKGQKKKNRKKEQGVLHYIKLQTRAPLCMLKQWQRISTSHIRRYVSGYKNFSDDID